MHIKIPAAAIAILLTAGSASAQYTGENVTFPLVTNNPNNRIEYVTRVNNTTYMSETGVKHSVLAADVVLFDIINDHQYIDPYDNYTVYTVRFYYANCNVQAYSLYAQTSGDRASLSSNITYFPSSKDVSFGKGATTPEGIRAAEACGDIDMLFK